MSENYAYENCIIDVAPILKKRGVEKYNEMAANLCRMRVDEGTVREFAVTNGTQEDSKRTFALALEKPLNIGKETIDYPVIAITSGVHDADGDQKVYIEPSILEDHVEAFSELPVYFNHQRTDEDLIGTAINPEIIKLDDGKTGIKMLAKIQKDAAKTSEVLGKLENGDMTHVSIDWFSNDIDVMGDTYATNIRPTEVSFIDNEKMDPVCKECTIEEGKECDAQVSEDDHDSGCGGEEEACACEDGKTEVEIMSEETKETTVKSEAENIVEREFASLRTQLEEAEASKKEIESEFKKAMKELEVFKKAEEERLAKEAEAKKLEAVEAIISKEVLFGTIEEANKDARVEELSAWDESRLTGFSEALAAMPEPQVDSERTFGKGKASEGEAVPEATERKFGVKMVNGRIVLNKEVLTGE